MKILRLKIKNPIGEIIQDIPFKENGISFIFGDIQDPKNFGATINSLGKTLLLKCIDYIYGANEDISIVKKEIHNYILEAIILHDSKEYVIRRVLGNSEQIFIGNVPYTLTDYKNYFKIKRSIYGKQLIINKKVTEISYRSNADKEDVMNYLELLHLNELLPHIESIYKSQDKIKEYKTNKKELVSLYGEVDLKQIDEEIYFVDKEVNRLTIELNRITEKIKGIEISELQQNIVEEYAEKSKLLKKIKSEYEKNRLECERLIEFIDNSNKTDVSSEHIIAIFNKAKLEVPDMVKRNLQEVESFHKTVFEERKEFLSGKKQKIELEMNNLQKKITNISEDVDRLGAIISVNEVYQESIELYEKHNRDLNDLKFKEGKLSQIKSIDDNIDIEDKKLVDSFNNADQIRKEYETLIQKYRDFIYDITKNIYDDDTNSYFDIKIRKKHLSTRPVLFDVNLKGDTGEGVNEVRKNLIDYLVFRYNTHLDMMLQDSACYNGIDPRQVSGMLFELGKIAIQVNKQVIVAINKYQVGEYTNAVDFINQNCAITLSESEKLMKFDF